MTAQNQAKRHTVSILVQDQFGVLARISGLFAARGYNIKSLTVAPTLKEGISRITIVTEGSNEILEQINKQLNKLIDVLKVLDLKDIEYVDRELLLIKIKADAQNRAEIMRTVDIFRGRIVDVSPKSYTVEITGGETKCQAVIDLLKPYGIIEIVRTGKVAITRGQKRLLDLKAKRTLKANEEFESMPQPQTDGANLA